MDSAVSTGMTKGPSVAVAGIRREFAGSSRPADDRIALGDERYDDYEGNRVGAALAGKSWQDLRFEELQRIFGSDPSSFVHFLTDEGLRYFLPALAVMSMEDDAADADRAGLIEAFIHSVSPPETDSDPIIGERFRHLTDALTPSQAAAIAAAVAVVAERLRNAFEPGNDAQRALDAYWGSCLGVNGHDD